MGKNRSAGQTNRVNRSQKKDTHSLYLQCFHQRSFQKFSEKSYKFKFRLFTDKRNLIWWKSLRVSFGQMVNYFMAVFIGNWIGNFRLVQWRKYNTIVNVDWTIRIAVKNTYSSLRIHFRALLSFSKYFDCNIHFLCFNTEVEHFSKL